MKAKGKIILSSIALVLVVTLAIVAVFALTQTSTSSSFKVNFIGTRNVKATINAKSKLSNNDTIIETPTSVTFDGSSSDIASKTINFATEVTIPSTDVTADYIFEIYNKLTDDRSAELIVEPSVEENGLTNATITTYYQTNTANEYSQFTGTYTYATLAKGQAIRFKVSIKINDGITTDVTIKDAKISFKLYTHTTAPSDYEGSAISVATSDLRVKVSYGEYPQTYVGDTLNAELKGASTTELVATGKEYTVYLPAECKNISFGYDQVETKVKEYSYKGKKYVKVEKAVSDAYCTDEATNKFTNGDLLVDDEAYFFEVEPIVFTVMEEKDGRAILYVDKLLCPKSFNNYDANNYDAKNNVLWANSDARAYMNGAFATDSGLADIALESTIDNTLADGSSGGMATTDKLYAASLDELSKWFPHVGESIGAKVTDFAKAIGCLCMDFIYSHINQYAPDSGDYYTRSAMSDTEIQGVSGLDNTYRIFDVELTGAYYGMRFAMQVAI